MADKRSDIRISVSMDDEGVTGIRWETDDAPDPGLQRAKAMLLALWDAEERNAMRIDLWTKDMTVEDMNDFFFQTLLTLAETYQRSTAERDLAADIKLFAREFADKAAAREQRRQQGIGPA
jgi:gliding motility-associated protein GldC